MKDFIYFEQIEGGMEVIKLNFNNDDYVFPLFGWMSEEYGCKSQDLELVKWCKKAKIGDYFEHRLGVCVRVNNLMD